MSYSSSHNSCSNVQFIAIFSLSKWLGGGLEAELKKKLKGIVKLYFDNYI